MLTVLHEKLAEAHGLAIAAAVVVDKVEERTLDLELRRRLWTMQEEAAEVRARCLEAERGLGPADELLAHANVTRGHAADLAAAWFKAGTSPLRAWSFLAMGEAGEVATWAAVQALAARANLDGIAELSAWALPLQRRHLELALDGAAQLARLADPQAPRWG
jgi:hypothetical protein